MDEPDGWPKEGLRFHLVGSVEKRVALANEIAGDKIVAVATPTITQQCINLGRLDVIRVDLAPTWTRRAARRLLALGAIEDSRRHAADPGRLGVSIDLDDKAARNDKAEDGPGSAADGDHGTGRTVDENRD